MTKFSPAYLKRLGVTIEKQKKTLKIPKRDPVGLAGIKTYLTLSGLLFETEHKFHPKRKWRFDIAFPLKKIAIEYEGTNSAKSRHTTLTGYSGDCEKYNAALTLGWKVLRYTALNYKDCKKDLAELLNGC